MQHKSSKTQVIHCVSFTLSFKAHFESASQSAMHGFKAERCDTYAWLCPWHVITPIFLAFETNSKVKFLPLNFNAQFFVFKFLILLWLGIDKYFFTFFTISLANHRPLAEYQLAKKFPTFRGIWKYRLGFWKPQPVMFGSSLKPKWIEEATSKRGVWPWNPSI